MANNCNCNSWFLAAWILMGCVMTLVIVGLADPSMSVNVGNDRVKLGAFRYCREKGNDYDCELYTSSANDDFGSQCDKSDGGYNQNGNNDSVDWCGLRMGTASMIVFMFFGNFIGIIGQSLFICGYDFRKLSSFGIAIGGFCGFLAMCLWADFVVSYNGGRSGEDEGEITVGAAFACVTAGWILDVVCMLCLYKGGLFVGGLFNGGGTKTVTTKTTTKTAAKAV